MTNQSNDSVKSSPRGLPGGRFVENQERLAGWFRKFTKGKELPIQVDSGWVYDLVLAIQLRTGVYGDLGVVHVALLECGLELVLVDGKIRTQALEVIPRTWFPQHWGLILGCPVMVGDTIFHTGDCWFSSRETKIAAFRGGWTPTPWWRKEISLLVLGETKGDSWDFSPIPW